MPMFEASTTLDESPEQTEQEENGAEEQQAPGADNQEAGPDNQETAEQSSSEESEQEGQTQDEYVPATTYRELRGEFTRKSQENAELKRKLEQFQGQRQAPPDNTGQGKPQPPQNWEEFNQQLSQYQKQLKEAGYSDLEINALSAGHVANFRLHLRDQQDQQAQAQRDKEQVDQRVNSLKQDFKQLETDEGMDALAAKTVEIARELGNPALAENPSEKLLRIAAQEVFGDGKAELYQKGKTKGREEALETIKTKQGLTAPPSTKPNEQPKPLEDQIADSIVNAGRKGGIFS